MLSRYGEEFQKWQHDALKLAQCVAGEEYAYHSISMGGPQIMGFNHTAIGYSTAQEMFQKFSATESAQVHGFFQCLEKCFYDSDAGKQVDLVPYLRTPTDEDWLYVARLYNGKTNQYQYRDWLIEAYNVAREVLATKRQTSSFDKPSKGVITPSLLFILKYNH